MFYIFRLWSRTLHARQPVVLNDFGKRINPLVERSKLGLERIHLADEFTPPCLGGCKIVHAVLRERQCGPGPNNVNGARTFIHSAASPMLPIAPRR
jgi:hypothetical protein